MKQNSAGGGVSSSQPAASKDSQRGGDHSSADGAVLLKFKSLSAKALAKIIGDKIQNFKPEFWIEEDVNGAAFLDVVSSPRLSELLQQDVNEFYFIKRSIALTSVICVEHSDFYSCTHNIRKIRAFGVLSFVFENTK